MSQNEVTGDYSGKLLAGVTALDVLLKPKVRLSAALEGT